MPPPLRDQRLIIFFGVMTLVGAIGWVREGNPWPTLGFLAFTIAASWLVYRLRVFGAPTIDMDSKGLAWRSGKREEFAAWRDISAIEWDFTRNEIRFVRKGGRPPIRTHSRLVTDDGEWFDMLIEEYWNPPKRRRT